MFSKEVKTEFAGQRIVVRNTWRVKLGFPFMESEIKLYVNGKVVDSSDEYYSSGRTAILRGSVEGSGKTHEIEVFRQSALDSHKIKICIDGKYAAGKKCLWWQPT